MFSNRVISDDLNKVNNMLNPGAEEAFFEACMNVNDNVLKSGPEFLQTLKSGFIMYDELIVQRENFANEQNGDVEYVQDKISVSHIQRVP